MRHRHGLGLFELMIAIALSSFVIAGIATYLSQQQRLIDDMSLKLALRSIAARLEQTLSNPAAIAASSAYSSAAGNRALKDCISKPSKEETIVRPCTATDPERQQYFELYLPLPRGSKFSRKLVEDKLVAGTDLSPALYPLRSTHARCQRKNVADKGCDLHVVATFWASCAPNLEKVMGDQGARAVVAGTELPPDLPSSCTTAQTLNFRYQIRYAPAQGSLRRRIDNFPRDKAFWKDEKRGVMSSTGAITMPIDIIPSEEGKLYSCPPNYSLTSIEGGKAKCECLFPFKLQKGSFGVDICIAQESKCANTERYRGLTPDGKIICKEVRCEPKTVDWSKPGGGCDRGGWVESIRPVLVPDDDGNIPTSSCVATQGCGMTKWGGSCSVKVTCYEEIYCCYEDK